MVARNPNRAQWKLRQRNALLQAERRVRDAEARLEADADLAQWRGDLQGAALARLFSSLCVGCWDRHRAIELVAEGYAILRDLRAKQKQWEEPDLAGTPPLADDPFDDTE